MKNTRKGFTLVELLAVIVILAIIMIIAIPAVLQTMNLARQKTFKEYITKVYTAAQTYQVAQSTAGAPNKGALYTVTISGIAAPAAGSTEENRSSYNGSVCYAYDIAKIGLSSVGDYKGTVFICENPSKIDSNSAVLIALKDANYTTKGIYDYTKNGEMPVESLGTDTSVKTQFFGATSADNATNADLNAVIGKKLA